MVDEIVQQLGQAPDYILCPVGTAGTISGIIAHSSPKTKVIGVCVEPGPLKPATSPAITRNSAPPSFEDSNTTSEALKSW